VIHPDTELRFIDGVVGYGVVATRLIPKGTITWVGDDLDQRFSREQVAAMAPHYRDLVDTYSFVDWRGEYVLCWDHGRFVNHSCQPTCLAPGMELEVAVRDILPGDELTDDYGTLNLDEPFTCCRGCSGCRGQIQAGDLLTYAAAWDALVAPAFARIRSLEQPLWPFVREPGLVERALRDPASLPSCRALYWPRSAAA